MTHVRRLAAVLTLFLISAGPATAPVFPADTVYLVSRSKSLDNWFDGLKDQMLKRWGEREVDLVNAIFYSGAKGEKPVQLFVHPQSVTDANRKQVAALLDKVKLSDTAEAPAVGPMLVAAMDESPGTIILIVDDAPDVASVKQWIESVSAKKSKQKVAPIVDVVYFKPADSEHATQVQAAFKKLCTVTRGKLTVTDRDPK